LEVKPLGTEAGAGNLVICEILKAHFRQDLLDENGKPRPTLTDLVARSGGDWYTHASAEAMFKVEKPNTKLGIGFNQLPEDLLHSEVLSGNDLAKLANVDKVPELEESEFITPINEDITTLHKNIKNNLGANNVLKAWKTYLSWKAQNSQP
jgi:hypothetical protein